MSAATIALLGAECTGKSTLAQGLETALQAQGVRVARVDETLRQWCDEHGRTPLQHEQAAIAAAQAQAVQIASTQADVVLVDTTPLITALYSLQVFADNTLLPAAVAHQRGYTLNLLTATDLPWVTDGLQRDGQAPRLAFDSLLRSTLEQHRLAYTTVLGRGPVRLQRALAAIQRHVLNQPTAPTKQTDEKPWKWMCERCSDAACEHRLFRALTDAKP